MTKERFQQLSNMTPTEGIRAWLSGDFATGEGPALMQAIRKDRRITLSDDEVMDILCDAATESWDAQRCLDHLVAKSD